MSRPSILLICSWMHRTSDLLQSLRSEAIDAVLWRVDSEPGVYAALKQRAYDVVIFCDDTPGIALDLVTTHVLLHRPDATFIVLESVDELGVRLGEALQGR
jgi:hypothetical protein